VPGSPRSYPCGSRSRPGARSQHPLLVVQDVCWSEGEKKPNTMQWRHTTVVLDPSRWGLFFSLALMLASIVRSPAERGPEKDTSIEVRGRVNASLLLIAHDTGVESFVPVAKRV